MAIDSLMMSFGETVPALVVACAVPEALMAVQDEAKSMLESENIVFDESRESPGTEREISSKRFISGEGPFSGGTEME